MPFTFQRVSSSAIYSKDLEAEPDIYVASMAVFPLENHVTIQVSEKLILLARS